MLDILKVAYTDLYNSRLTTYSILIPVITRKYNTGNARKVQHAITTITGGVWFKREGKSIYLSERGVELYFQLDQSHQSQIAAQKAIKLALYSILISGLLAIASIVVTLIKQ